MARPRPGYRNERIRPANRVVALERALTQDLELGLGHGILLTEEQAISVTIRSTGCDSENTHGTLKRGGVFDNASLARYAVQA